MAGRYELYRFEPRTVGAARGEIEKRLGGVDQAGLLSVGDIRIRSASYFFCS